MSGTDNNTLKSTPIDAVITWVDGNDPDFFKRAGSAMGIQNHDRKTGVSQSRYRSQDEIRYCVLSILKFAPFIRNIFIVTDGQSPKIFDVIGTYFPDRVDSIRIVDHKEIFRDFEEYLPTFSSRSIESMLWRIKGLSENFVYFNDDVFLVREIKEEEWFSQNKPVLQGKWLTFPWHRIILYRILRLFVKGCLNKSGNSFRPSYHMGQWRAASLLGFKVRYFFFSHTAFPVNRNLVEEYLSKHTDLIRKNLNYRVKNDEQFNFVALSNHLQLLTGNNQIVRPQLVYLQPFNRSKNYIDRKIGICEKNSHIRYMCVQSLELCSEEEQKKIFSWMDKVLNLSV
jgi:hypothetical protein